MGTRAFFDDPERAETAKFLASLFEDDLTTVLQHMEARRYADGELAIRAGERDRSIHIVTEGRFEVLLPGDRPRRPILERGAMFGELAFFDGLPRSADVRAVGAGEVYIMTQAGFERLRLTHPRLAMEFV